jgi:hypothetical protein
MATASLVGPDRAAAAAAAATHKYEVFAFTYDAEANAYGDRSLEPCDPNVSAYWGGLVETAPSDLAPLHKLGDGVLKVREKSSLGSVYANADFSYNFFGAHNVTTNCEEMISRDTTCQGAVSSGVEVSGFITGGDGTRLKILWEFRQNDVQGAWVPDNYFYCGQEAMTFPSEACQSQVSLKTLVKKRFELPFHCTSRTVRPPYDSTFSHYNAEVILDGSLGLRRTSKK